MTVCPARFSLLGGGQPGGSAPDHGHGFAGARFRRHRLDPPLLVPPVADLFLDVFDGDGIGVDAEHAGRFARGRADPPRELREVVGAEQHFQRPFPIAQVHLVVELRYDVAQGASHVAERHRTVHAAPALLGRLLIGPAVVILAIIADPF